MRYAVPFFVFALIAGASIVSVNAQSENQKFQTLANRYIAELLAMNPELATGLGEHRYDHRLSDYSLSGIKQEQAFNQRYLDELTGINLNNLSQVNRIDYQIMRSQVEGRIFAIDELRDYEWNPLAYNPGSAIYMLIARDFAPLSIRMKSVRERLRQLPAVLEAAQANLKNPPRVHTETAIIQNKGNIGLVRDELKTFLNQVPEVRESFLPVQAAAVRALEEYGAFLERELLPRSTGDFRLGDAKYRRKLRYTLESDLSKEEILRRAEADLKRTQEQMYETALPLYRKFFPNERDATKLANRKSVSQAVLAKLAEQHPTNETIVELANRTLQETTSFVQTENLVTLPGDPIKIIVMPEFQRGVAVAYCDAAGPLEKRGATFYAISPTPKDWSAARVDSFFREYNNYMVENLTVHEAMPGHYLQLAHANRFKAPTLVRAIFSSGPFIEGWAVYAERVMAERGYGGPEVRMQQLKMRLRTIINAILDQKIHTAGMTEKEAIDLMMNEGFQEEGEAAGKWRRAMLTSTQLSTYYVGVAEVEDIRQAYEAKHNGKTDLKKMHDQMLSFGSPAPKYIRESMGL